MAHPLRIQRKRTNGYRLPAGAVVVTRPTKWGNPFIVDFIDGGWVVRSYNGDMKTVGYPTENHAKAGCVRLYRAYLDNDGTQPGAIRDEGGAFLKQLAKDELRGKQLACYCSLTAPCHADVLCEIANS